MLNGPRMVSLRVPDLQAAKGWYAAVLGRDPVFDAPFAVAFSTGDCALMLLPAEAGTSADQRCVSYFAVDDIDAAYGRLLSAGATSRSEITFTMLGARMAKVQDPFGNVLGIMSAANEATAVDSRPSESAMTVAFSRALAAHDDREGLGGPDYLAEVFLNEEGRKALDDRVAREWIVRKMAGTHEYFLARTRYIDQVVGQSLRDRVPQVVMLGAGYDTRACRFRELLEDTRVFELDVNVTQQRKRTMLERARVAVPPQVAWVTIDFEKQSLADALLKAGFDERRNTLFIWEGVSYYLTAQSVDQALDSIRRHSPAGSTICFDYMIQAPDITARHGVRDVLDAWRTAYTGEPVRFGIDEGTIDGFLAQRHYRLVEHLEPADLEQRFLRKPDGTLAGSVVALFGLARASVCA